MNDQRAIGEHMCFAERERALSDTVSRRLTEGASTSEGGRDAD